MNKFLGYEYGGFIPDTLESLILLPDIQYLTALHNKSTRDLVDFHRFRAYSWEYDRDRLMESVDFEGEIPRKGGVYTKFPYQRSHRGKPLFISAEKLSDVLMEDRERKVIEVLQLLGVSSYSMKSSIQTLKEYTLDFGSQIGAEIKEYEGSLDFKLQTKDSHTREESVKWEYTFSGGGYDYDKAVELAKSYHLYDDPEIGHLIRLRSSQTNRFTSRQIKTSIDDILNKSLSIAANAAYMQSGCKIKLDLSFVQTVCYKKKTNIEIDMQFGE